MELKVSLRLNESKIFSHPASSKKPDACNAPRRRLRREYFLETVDMLLGLPNLLRWRCDWVVSDFFPVPTRDHRAHIIEKTLGEHHEDVAEDKRKQTEGE